MGSEITVQKERRPHPQNWSNSQLVEWLGTHPITNEEDVKFLREEEQNFYDMIVEANNEAVSDHVTAAAITNIWNNTTDMGLYIAYR